ncbi:Alpha/beta hydrolase fold-containing protein 5 [Elsinoe fawcettii]|nr:Alpha/beta hydrolase fold-containing protein 5 [Elsinoe fawcettii]
MIDIKTGLVVAYSLTLIVIQLPIITLKLTARRLLGGSEISYGADMGRTLSRELLGLPLTFMRLMLGPSLAPNFAASKRYGPIAKDLFQPVPVTGFGGSWHFQGPPGTPTRAKDCDKVIYFIHGGAYVVGSPKPSIVQHLRVAEVCAKDNVKLALFGLQYPLAPEATWPAPVEAAVAGYRWLIEHEGVDPSNIVPWGESAGGHLVVALLHEIVRQRLPKPGYALLLFPWLNLNNRSSSFDRNKNLDMLEQSKLDDSALMVLPHTLREKYKAVLDYSRPSDGQSLKQVLPPKTWIAVGDHDVFVDDIIRWTDLCRKDGADVELSILPGQAHGGLATSDVLNSSTLLALEPGQDAEGVLPGAEYLAKGILSMVK